MDTPFEIIPIDENNVDKNGFFCYMSKRKEPGWKLKRDWLSQRFREGLKILMVNEVGRRITAFIEYIPGEYAWRVVNAPGYLVIHCLWVVGQGRGKGFGARLIEACVADARAQDKLGVVMVSSDKPWLADKKAFLRNGFEEVDQAPPSFQLLVHKLKPGPLPSFPTNWEERRARFGSGLSVIRTDQCPYMENATHQVEQIGEKYHIPVKVVEYKTSQELQQNSPTPYGTFSTILDGKLLSYYYMTEADFKKLQ
ncbi:MAG TPA: GNAT family N-acetyltransferase [Longilinea sp.]|nr:GNAT family N-acetyltransferase [Longilinea sp.]